MEKEKQKENGTEKEKYKFTDEMMTRYKDVLNKFMIVLLDKYGVMVVDWMGYILRLNKNDKPISQQSVDEIASSLNELNEKLKDPRIKAELILIIKESEPILKEGLITFLRVGTAGFNYIIKDLIVLLCNESPAAPVCGLLKFIANTLELGNELIEASDDSIRLYEEAGKWVEGLREKMDKLNEDADQVKTLGNEYSDNIQNVSDDITNKTKNTLNQYNDNIQTQLDKYNPIVPGGTEQYKKTLNKYNDEFQKSADNVNQSVKDTTNNINQRAQDSVNNLSSEVNKYAQNTANQAISGINPTDQTPSFQKGGAARKVMKNNNLIKMRTRKSFKDFKRLSRKRVLK